MSQKLIFQCTTEITIATCVGVQHDNCTFSGNAFNKPRNYPPDFGKKFASLFEHLNGEKLGVPELPPKVPTAEESFAAMDFCDVWQDAQVVAICHWLRGGRSLQIPDSFRCLIPTKL